MIDFSTQQLTWLFVGATTIGGGGYITMNQKLEEVDKKVAVANANLEYQNKSLDKLEIQLSRIEQKLDTKRTK